MMVRIIHVRNDLNGKNDFFPTFHVRERKKHMGGERIFIYIKEFPKNPFFPFHPFLLHLQEVNGMYIDKNAYIGAFNTRRDDLREGVMDYLLAFLRRRREINVGIPVELVRRHCEQTLHAEVPMDIMIGALLYARYAVNNINGQWYAGISWESPLGKMLQHRCIDRMTLNALRSWYGSLIDPATGKHYDVQ